MIDPWGPGGRRPAGKICKKWVINGSFKGYFKLFRSVFVVADPLFVADPLLGEKIKDFGEQILGF